MTIGTRTSISNRPHRIQLQRPSVPIQVGDGTFLQTWADLSPAHVFAQVKPATTVDLERLALGTVISNASHVITFPFHPDVTVATRMVYRGRVFQVTGVSTPDEEQVETICLAVELIGADLLTDYAWTQPGWTSETPAWMQGGTF
jgi:head-tail adaptor